LKNLFAQADQALHTDVKDAVGMRDQFVSLYVHSNYWFECFTCFFQKNSPTRHGGRLLLGPVRLVTKTVEMG